MKRECSGIGAAPENPAKDVPYFSGAKVGYGGRGMQAAIEKAHSLPGRPKVLVADFYYALSRSSSPIPVKNCSTPGLAGPGWPPARALLGSVAERYEQYTQLANAAYRQAAADANKGSKDGPYAVAADGLFTVDNAVPYPGLQGLEHAADRPGVPAAHPRLLRAQLDSAAVPVRGRRSPRHRGRPAVRRCLSQPERAQVVPSPGRTPGAAQGPAEHAGRQRGAAVGDGGREAARRRVPLPLALR
ncbi:hypothetical protein ACRAWF_41985 [Streptomyces sp. L7]